MIRPAGRLAALVWLAAWAAAVIGCGGDEGDPCLGLDCGPHGQCDQGTCLCQAGYQPTADGRSCQDFPVDECDGIDCSGLGTCSLEPLGPYGMPQPTCLCLDGAVPTEDGLDCVEPCAGVDCAPGSCSPGPLGEARCECPPGYQATAEPPACSPQTDWAWELVYDTDNGPYVMGRAWLSRRQTAEGHQVEAAASYAIPVSYQGVAGGDVLTVARFDPAGELVEVVQDQQVTFGSHTARRRLNLQLDPGAADGALLRFESRILDRLWRGAFALDTLPGGLEPLPMADGYEYPIPSWGCFDPFFYWALGHRLDPDGPAEQTVGVLAPSFVLPFELTVRVGSQDDVLTAELPDYGVSATYQAGVLERISYSWADWIPADADAALETNLRPLPNNPIEHLPEQPPAAAEQEVAFASADGTLLAGSLALPDGPAERTALLMVPGLLPDTRDRPLLYTAIQRDLAVRLAAAGFASLRFDGRGTGASEGQTTCPPERLAEDLDAAFAWLLADERFDRVVLLAHGFATPPALRAAGRLPAAGLVVLAPTGDDLTADLFHRTAAVILEAGLGQQMVDAYFEPFAAELQARQSGATDEDMWDRSAAFWRAWLGRDPLDVAAIACPVLLLAGDQDIVLPASHLDLLAAAFLDAGHPARSELLPGLSHALTPGRIADLWEDVHLPRPVATVVTERILAWLAELPAGRRGGAP